MLERMVPGARRFGNDLSRSALAIEMLSGTLYHEPFRLLRQPAKTLSTAPLCAPAWSLRAQLLIGKGSGTSESVPPHFASGRGVTHTGEAQVALKPTQV